MNLCMCNALLVKLLTVIGKEAAGDSMCITGRARLSRRTAGVAMAGSAVHGDLAFTNGEIGGIAKKKAN